MNYTPPVGHSAPDAGHLHKLSHKLLPSQSLPLSQPGLLPMRAFIVEITAKLVVRSETDPEELPADIYAHIAEFLPSDDDILDLEVNAVPLPVDLSGSTPH